MQESQINASILKHLSGEETREEGIAFLEWCTSSEENKRRFARFKTIWELPLEDEPITFRGKFTLQKIKTFIVNRTIGHFIGFAIGLSVTRFFTHSVLEKRNVHNLFGIVKRKEIIVNDMPDWLQSTLAIVLGYITLEFINYLFETKKHIMVWEFLKKVFHEKIKPRDDFDLGTPDSTRLSGMH